MTFNFFSILSCGLLLILSSCQNEVSSVSNLQVKKGVQDPSSMEAIQHDILIYLEEKSLELWQTGSEGNPTFISQHSFSTSTNLLPGLYQKERFNTLVFNYLYQNAQLNKEVVSVEDQIDLEIIFQEELLQIIKDPAKQYAKLIVFPNKKIISKPGYPHWLTEVMGMLEIQQSKYVKDVE